MHATAYGLTFESADLALPELTARQATTAPNPEMTVTIEVGRVPSEIPDAKSSGVLYQASPDQFLLRVPDVAAYLVERDRIVVEAAPSASDHEVRVFMLGSAVGALLHLRGLLVMHAAAFLHESGPDDQGAGAILLAGASGAGKSTLLGEFLRRGRSMIVDDVCAVDLVDDTATVRPGYPRTRLWADSAAKLELETEPLVRTRPSIEKFERQVPANFHDSPVPFASLFILTSHNQSTIEIEPVAAIDAFTAVLANTYRRTFLDGLAMRKDHFRLASAVAAGVPVARVRRPSGGFALSELADAIEAHIAGPTTPAET